MYHFRGTFFIYQEPHLILLVPARTLLQRQEKTHFLPRSLYLQNRENPAFQEASTVKSVPPKTETDPPLSNPKSGEDLPLPSPLSSASNPIVISGSPVKDDGDTWVRDPYLRVDDKAVIESSVPLNCRVIDASHQVLKKHVHLSGFQSSQYGKDYRFKTVSGHFVQILNVMHGSHWITVSNINCDSDTVNVYDSAYAFIDMDMKLQICSFIRPSCDVLTLRMPNIQHQPNSFDSGVFSIATATELALGRDPHLCYWDTTQMRSHLIKCLEQGKMESFPQKKCRRIPPGNRYKKTMPIKSYCKCRMPNETSKAMVKCDSCRKWVHKECMGLDPTMSVENTVWYCSLCK